MSQATRSSAPPSLWTIIVMMSLILYVPLIWLAWGSFHELQSDGKWVFTLRWYGELWGDQLVWQSLSNSFYVAFISSCISTFLGAIVGLSMTQESIWQKKFIQVSTSISLALPEIVFSISLLLFFFILNIPLSLNTVILAHALFSFAFVAMTVTARCCLFDQAQVEAARDLGANDTQIILKIILPFLSPALFTGWVLSFLISFDDFLLAFFLNGIGSDTWPVKLYSAMRAGLSPKLNALTSCMMLISMVILLSFFYLRFRKGKEAT
ncbi:MAG: ABC transporter permease [Bdellovibrionota bacterium]